MVSTAMMFLLAVMHAPAGWPISFEKDLAPQWLRPGGLKVFERVQAHATDGQRALHVVFPGSDRDTWPGFTVIPPTADLSSGLSLVFDVFNPEEKALSLSWRIDDQEGHHVFGGTTLRPGKTTHVEIWTLPMRFRLNLSRMKGFYLYLRKPREDHELYFDNLCFATVTSAFRPVLHVPAHKPPALPAAEGPPIVAFHRPWVDPVFGNDWPAEDERVQDLSLAAARGEYEPLTLSLAARRGVQDLRLQLSDFRGPGKLSASLWQVRVVRCLDKRWTYHDAHNRYIKDMPVLLEPQTPEGQGGLALEAGRVGRFWVTVKVPPRARPGMYQGTLTVTGQETAGGREFTLEVPVRLRVYPFELPEPTDKFYGVYYTGPCALEAGDKLDKLRQNLQDMREHGMTSVGLCFGWNPAQTDVERRRVDFMLPGQGRYETFMSLYSKLKFPAPVIQLADTVQAAVGAQIPTTDECFAATYAETWQFVEDYAREQKWPEIIVQPVDEPAWQGKDAMERNRLLLEILKRLAPRIRTEQDGPANDYFHRVAGPLADVWNYNGGLGLADRLAQAKKQGKIILLYNCDVEWYRPVVDRYVAGWFQALSGADGCFNWAYQSFGGDPYDDQDAKNGDHMAQYPPLPERPGYEARPGGPSTAWEAFREGVDDFKYISLLRTLIQRGEMSKSKEARRLAHRAREKLDALFSSIKYSPRVRGQARFERYWEEDGKLFISGPLQLPNGWTGGDYDRARREIADLAARLKSAL